MFENANLGTLRQKLYSKQQKNHDTGFPLLQVIAAVPKHISTGCNTHKA